MLWPSLQWLLQQTPMINHETPVLHDLDSRFCEFLRDRVMIYA
jgi:hypothetical protein